MPYLTPSGGQPATIPRRSKAATATFRAARDPGLTTRPAHYLPSSSLKPLTNSNASSAAASPAGGPSGVGSASGRQRSRSDLTPRPHSSAGSRLREPSPNAGEGSEDGMEHISRHVRKVSLSEYTGNALSPPPAPEEREVHTRRDSTPSLSSHAASASSVSVASLGATSDDLEGDASADTRTTPATSVGVSHSNSEDGVVMVPGGGSREDRNEAVKRYMQELYAFHRRLYEEAKQDAEGAPRRGSFSQFGEKQSGMAKMAAKKALASKLNS